MAQCTLNGVGVYDGSVTFPRIGVWHADLSVATLDAPSGTAEFVLGSQTWQGAFSLQSGRDLGGRQRVRVVGGMGTLGTLVQAKGYNPVIARIPLADALTDSGESLSASSDPAILNYTLNGGWVRFASPGSSALLAILDSIPNTPSWRVVPDGSIWVGYETWPVVNLDNTAYLKSDPSHSSIMIGSYDPDIAPGEILQFSTGIQDQQNLKVSVVTHNISSGRIQTSILYENF